MKGRFSKVVGATATYTATGISIVPLPPATPFGEVAGIYQGLAPVTSGNGLEGRLGAHGLDDGKVHRPIHHRRQNVQLRQYAHFRRRLFRYGHDRRSNVGRNLTADLSGASQAITGTIGIGGTSYQVDVHRAAFSATNPPPVIGVYTIVLPPNADNSDPNAPRPQGTGWATATISAAGSVRWPANWPMGRPSAPAALWPRTTASRSTRRST